MAMKTDAARSCTVSTPNGPFTLVTGHGGADGAADGVARTDYVLASGWIAEIAELVGLIHPSLRPSHTEALPEVECDGLLARAVAAVRSYYRGESSAPGDVPVLQVGGPFIERAWSRLREVPAGTTLPTPSLPASAGIRPPPGPRPRPVRVTPRRCSSRASGCGVPTGALDDSATGSP